MRERTRVALMNQTAPPQVTLRLKPGTRRELATQTEPGAHSGGKPLDHASRAYFEPRFGHDFSQVRVHTDAQAAESVERVNANAYSVGHDILFGAGRYEPVSPAGRRLLGHELTHVAQRDRYAASQAHAGKVTISERSDPAEREAARVGQQVAAGSRVQALEAPSADIAREEAEKKDEDPLSGPLGAVGEILEMVGTATGHEGLGHFAKGVSAGSGVGGAVLSPDVLSVGGAAAGIADLFGVPGAGVASSYFGEASGVKEGLEADSLEGKILGGLKAAQGAGAAIAGVGGFELANAAGMSVSALPGAAAAGELGSAGMLGPGAAVLGAGIAGWEAGKGLDKLSDWIGHQVSDDKSADYSLSGMGADYLTAKDQALTDTMRSLGLYDESKPAYTQTIGWRLANLFD